MHLAAISHVLHQSLAVASVSEHFCLVLIADEYSGEQYCVTLPCTFGIHLSA